MKTTSSKQLQRIALLARSQRLARIGRIMGLALAVLSVPGTASAGYVGTVLYQVTRPAGYGEPTAMWAGDGSAVGFFVALDGNNHAMAWATDGAVVDLNPSGFRESYAIAGAGSHQVGYGNVALNGAYHALLWNGKSDTAVDLSPSGFDSSVANGVHGNQQVGAAHLPGPGNYTHAILWNGTAASAVDLNPAGFGSFAYATNEIQQVGFGSGVITGGFEHALLWSGTSTSAVDLHPTGILRSIAYGLGSTQQVGYAAASDADGFHAFLWTGSAASAIDLNPLGFDFSQANGTNDIQQVGYGEQGSTLHALLWAGTAESAIDLHASLPASGNWLISGATSIDATGNIYGFAGGVYNDIYGGFAVKWSPVVVPEPASAALLVAAVMILICLKCHRWTAASPTK